ncbi:MAG TPA: hypothetical protein VFI72_10470, partial [Candidatus Angelobacter sp.]|nr:hypothetical protein [Candidatus Angelobacter sp.]
EAAAMDMLRGINGAEKKYAATYKSGFSATLKALSGLPTDQPGPDHALLLDPAMASTPAVKSGYVFRYTQLDSSHYQVTASPVEFGKTGAKSFFMDENGQIRVTSEDREAGRNDSQSD